MKKYLLIFSALQKGVMLSNVETWKKTGVALAVMTALLSMISTLAVAFGMLPEGIDAETISGVASALVFLVTTVLGYLGVATTEKIGVEPKPKMAVPKEEKKAATGKNATEKTRKAPESNMWLDG